MSQRVIRLNDLASTPAKAGKLPVSPATIWRWVRQGKFPKPFKLSENVTVWDEGEVEAFIANRAVLATQSSDALASNFSPLPYSAGRSKIQPSAS